MRRVDLKPRVAGFDFPMLMELAKQGLGVTMLPETLCADAVRKGELEVVLPDWRLPQGIAHAVFASRRGLLPAVRVFIDFLAEKLPPLIEESSLNCRHCGKDDAANAAAAATSAVRKKPEKAPTHATMR